MITDYLGTGKDSARTGKEICGALNITPRELTIAVESERRKGQPICAATGSNPGYFLAANKEEMQTYCSSLKRRLGEIDKTRRACLSTISKLPEEVI